jgi:epoxyqueuosine reductase QueG
MWSEIQKSFRTLCAEEGREGLLAAVPLGEIRLLRVQAEYLRGQLVGVDAPPGQITALSLGMAYLPEEIGAVPPEWTTRLSPDSQWSRYARAYEQLNRSLNRVSEALAAEYDGAAELATLSGIASTVTHVSQYFPQCVSHRAVAEAAGLGWRGKHGLIVTPEFGPALRLATVFIPQRVDSPARRLSNCDGCTACLDSCPILRESGKAAQQDSYREKCRRRIVSLGLDAEVCGICVRSCWDAIIGGATGGGALPSERVE